MTKDKPITDLYLVAALLSYGFRWENVDRSNPDRQRFIFNLESRRKVFVKEGMGAVVKELSMDEMEEAYMNKTLLLPPNYTGVLRDVKYSVHSQRP